MSVMKPYRRPVFGHLEAGVRLESRDKEGSRLMQAGVVHVSKVHDIVPAGLSESRPARTPPASSPRAGWQTEHLFTQIEQCVQLHYPSLCNDGQPYFPRLRWRGLRLDESILDPQRRLGPTASPFPTVRLVAALALVAILALYAF